MLRDDRFIAYLSKYYVVCIFRSYHPRCITNTNIESRVHML